MKCRRAALGFVFLVTLAVAKAISVPELPLDAAEKKTSVTEKPTKAETSEVPEAIAIENAEEPKQADRAKKSATTTFCVEIRPGPAEAPVKVCEEHQPPPPPPPQQQQQPEPHHNYEQEPYFVVPQNPLVYVPNEPCPEPQYPTHFPPRIFNSGILPVPCRPQKPVITPSVPSNPCPPCPCPSSTHGLHPHTLIALLRSTMARNDATMPDSSMDSGLEMRSGSSDNWMPDTNSGLTAMNALEPSDQLSYRLDTVDTPFARTHNRGLYAVPGSQQLPSTYFSSPFPGYQQRKTPYLVKCSPQVIRLGGIGGRMLVNPSGGFRDASEDLSINNMETGAGNTDQLMSTGELQINLDTPQEARHHYTQPSVHPVIHTVPGDGIYNSHPSVVHHSSAYHDYHNQYMSPMHSHVPHPDYQPYAVHPQSSIRPPAGSSFYRREGPSPQPQQFPEISGNQQPTNMERTSSSDINAQQQHQRQQPPAMSPSRMLNQMRAAGGVGTEAGCGAVPFQRSNPVMQSFPREHEESPSNQATHVINGPRNSMGEKITETHQHAKHDGTVKREADKSSVSENDG